MIVDCGKNGAGDEVRTRDLQLGRLELYQLSYSRSIMDTIARSYRYDQLQACPDM
jgi:hypothetical protein